MTIRKKGQEGILFKHRRKIVGSIAVVATLVTTGSLCIYLLKRWLYKQQLKISKQHFVREQIRRRFSQTQQDSLYALYELIPVYEMVLNRNYDLEPLIIALRDKKLNKINAADKKNSNGSSVLSSADGALSSKNIGTEGSQKDTVIVTPPVEFKYSTMSKPELWNHLKLNSITKVVTISYTISSLFLLIRLQLNMLTRKEYLETAIRVAAEQDAADLSLTQGIVSWLQSWVVSPSIKKDDQKIEFSDDERLKSNTGYINEQAFLSLSWWLLNRGSLEIASVVQEKVETEFGPINALEKLSFEDFSKKLSTVFYNLNTTFFAPKSTTESPLKTILLPTESSKNYVLEQALDIESLRILETNHSILDELLQDSTTSITDESSLLVLESLVNESYQFIMSQLEQTVPKKTKSKTQQEEGQLGSFQLASFAMSCRDCANQMLKKGSVSLENEYLKRLDALQTMDDWSAMVYSNLELE